MLTENKIPDAVIIMSIVTMFADMKVQVELAHIIVISLCYYHICIWTVDVQTKDFHFLFH